MKQKKKPPRLKSRSSGKTKKQIPVGKVVLYAYVKPENKAYFEEIAELFGGVSAALDALLDDYRWKKRRIEVHLTREPKPSAS